MTTFPQVYRKPDLPIEQESTVFLGVHWIKASSETTRVKRSTETEKRGLARYAAKPEAERPDNIGLLSAVYTPFLPQGGL